MVGIADATWNALLRVVSEGMPSGRSYRREDIPEELRNRHRPIANTEHSVLQSLRDHSAFILDEIQATIGDRHLGRYRLVQQVIENLVSAQVILISGPAGSGKSVIAKDVLRIISDDYFTFSSGQRSSHAPTWTKHYKRSKSLQTRLSSGQFSLVRIERFCWSRALNGCLKNLLEMLF